jgi:hypothetical protein
MDTVHRILTFITRLTRLCLRLLNDRFVTWTTPNTTSLLLLTLTDQARSKSELVAENASLASTTGHPAPTGKTAYLFQDGPHAPVPAGKHGAELETGAVHCPARDAAARAAPGLQALVEIQVQSHVCHTQDLR